MPPRVAVLHHPNSFFPLELKSQVGTAAELVWVVDSSIEATELLHLLRRFGPVVDTCGLSLDDTAASLRALGVRGVVSFVDDHIVDAALLAERLGLAYHTPDVARSLVNKRLQRAVLDRAGIPGPAFWSTPSGLDALEARAFADRVSYPAVVKPAEGSGSRDMCLVRSSKELRAILTTGSGPGFLVEEYLEDRPGQEPWYASYLSVESVVSHGAIGHVAVTGRFPLAEPFRETGNFIPALFPPDEIPGLLALVDDTITALGITDSLTHTEIKLTADGPRLIEVNGRLGGRPPFVLGSVSTANLFQTACRVAFGEPIHTTGLARCDGVGFWLMLHTPMSACRLESVRGADIAAALSGVTDVRVNRSPGAELDWREGTDGKVVTIQGAVTDHCELAATIARVREAITITTDVDRPDDRDPEGKTDALAGLGDRVVEVPMKPLGGLSPSLRPTSARSARDRSWTS